MQRISVLRVRTQFVLVGVALAVSGCIWSESPKLSPDPVAATVVSNGYYERCFFSPDSKTGAMEKSKEGCKTVKVTVDAGGTVTSQTPGDTTIDMMIVNRLPNDALMIQSGGGGGKNQKYIFGFLTYEAAQGGGITVIFPSCKFSVDLRRMLEWKVGVTLEDDSGDNCDVGTIHPTTIQSLFRTLAESGAWSIQYLYTYKPLDQETGERRYHNEERLATARADARRKTKQ